MKRTITTVLLRYIFLVIFSVVIVSPSTLAQKADKTIKHKKKFNRKVARAILRGIKYSFRERHNVNENIENYAFKIPTNFPFNVTDMYFYKAWDNANNQHMFLMVIKDNTGTLSYYSGKVYCPDICGITTVLNRVKSPDLYSAMKQLLDDSNNYLDSLTNREATDFYSNHIQNYQSDDLISRIHIVINEGGISKYNLYSNGYFQVIVYNPKFNLNQKYHFAAFPIETSGIGHGPEMDTENFKKYGKVDLTGL